jgi:hypothetical protein
MNLLQGPFYNEFHHSVGSERAYTRDQWAMRDLIELTNVGSLQYAGPIGHDLLDLLQRWEQLGVPVLAASGAERGSVECVGEYLMKEHRNARHRIRHAAPEQVRALRSVRKKRSLLEGTLRREETSNWRQRELWEDIEFGQRELQAAEINSILKEHDGEVRVWQRRSEVWKPQIIDKFRTLSIYYGK